MNSNLTSLQAFNAMTKFLEVFYNKTNSDDIAILLSGMLFLKDDGTVDPAKWDDWIEIIGTNHSMTILEAFRAMRKFLKKYADLISSQDIEKLFNDMQLTSNNAILDSTINKIWNQCVAETLKEPSNARSYLKLVK